MDWFWYRKDAITDERYIDWFWTLVTWAFFAGCIVMAVALWFIFKR
jgi:hypothetical protein